MEGDRRAGRADRTVRTARLVLGAVLAFLLLHRALADDPFAGAAPRLAA